MQKPGVVFVWIAVIAVGFVFANFPGLITSLVVVSGHDAAVGQSVLQTLGHALLAVAVGSSIYGETRRIRRYGLSRKDGLMLLCSIGAAALMLVVGVRGVGGRSDIGTYMDSRLNHMRSQLSERIRTETSPVKRAELTHLYAQWTYEQEGTLITYQTPDGNAVTYSPSAEAKANREMALFWETHRYLDPKVKVGVGATWVVAIFVPIALGYALRSS